MIINFPKYPFIWNYDDMYNPIIYENKIIDSSELIEYGDEHLSGLLGLFPNSIVVKQNQKISKEESVNISIHTWYLAKNKLFKSDNSTAEIDSESNLKFKKEVFGFIYDPNDVFDKSIYNYDKKKNSPITILKNFSNINSRLIPNIYIHTHSIKGIFRFSPRDNSVIKFKDNITNPIFYVVLDGLILLSSINFL